MEPTIYALPLIDKVVEIKSQDFYYEPNPNPKLIKFGYNNINENLDLESITAIPQYRAGLNFDLTNGSGHNLSKILHKTLGVENVNTTFTEFWEIITLLGFLETNKNIVSNQPETMQKVVDAYQKMAKTTEKYYIHTIENIKKPTKSLIVFKYGDAEIDLDENTAIDIIMRNLNILLSLQESGSNMILQFFDLQTQISAELIYYLTSLYTSCYLFRPLSTSDLSDVKYLVLTEMKNNIVKPGKYIAVDDLYLVSLGIENVPESIVSIIQCMNSFVIPKKYLKYNQIRDYLSKRVYEGAIYQEMIKTQEKNYQRWIDFFTNLSNMAKLLDAVVQKTINECSAYSKLLELYQ